MAQRGALPPAVWACALLQRATTLLSAPQAEDRRAEVAALLEEQASVAGGERARAEGLGLRGLLLKAQGQPDEALLAFQEAGRAFGALGLARDQAITISQIADVLQARGQLDEALRIFREEVLPVFERLGDVHAKAITLGKIADVLQARGQLDEALRILREEELPVFERLGDVRAKAVTLGKIADVLQARGQLDEANRIRREEVLPVFERLGDVREQGRHHGQDRRRAPGARTARRGPPHPQGGGAPRLRATRRRALQGRHHGPDRRRAPGARTARRGPPHPQGGGAPRLRAPRRRERLAGQHHCSTSTATRRAEAARVAHLPLRGGTSPGLQHSALCARPTGPIRAEARAGEALRIRREEVLPVLRAPGESKA
ncbi:MAG: tetratricopeptide repeat protein [Deltaproteobacteria bacterium]|nr:tetratricopeptide repeat protein [Deltaproteobacteria bacterium]